MGVKRKYIRKCGECGEKHEQSEMVRTRLSDNGWLCRDCYYEVLDITDCDPFMTDADLGFNG